MPATAFKLSIPKPCHRDWQDMTPNEKGRHCSNCNKTVTDFTQLTDAAIANYFLQHHSTPTCGHFYNHQLSRITIQIPHYILQKHLPVWKRFLVVMLVCFGSSLFAVEVKAEGIFGAGEKVEKTKKVNKEDRVDKLKNTKTHKKHRRSKYRICTTLSSLGKIDILPSYEVGGYVQTVPEQSYPKADTPFFENDVTISNSGITRLPKKPSPFKKSSLPAEAVMPFVATVRRRRGIKTR